MFHHSIFLKIKEIVTEPMSTNKMLEYNEIAKGYNNLTRDMKT